MRIIHSNGFQVDERRQIKAVIYSNMIIAFRVLLEIMQTEDFPFADEKTKMYADTLEETEADLDADQAFRDEAIKDAMAGMWLDGGVQKAVSKGHEYALNDNLSLYVQAYCRSLSTPD